MITYTVKSKLLAAEHDPLDYHTLVFKVLESNCPFGHSFVMVTVFPNWQSRLPDIGEIGYLTYDEVVGGVDTFYDRNTETIMKYNFSNLIFKRFVKEKVDNGTKKEIIL